MLACFGIEEKVLFETKQLRLDTRKSANISEASLITFLGMSVSWLAFNISKLAICFRTSALSTCEKAKENSFPLLHTSPIASMLGWFLYFTIIGSSMLPTIGSRLSYWRILLCCFIEKNSLEKFHFQSRLFFHEMLFCQTKMVLQFFKTFYSR